MHKQTKPCVLIVVGHCLFFAQLFLWKYSARTCTQKKLNSLIIETTLQTAQSSQNVPGQCVSRSISQNIFKLTWFSWFHWRSCHPTSNLIFISWFLFVSSPLSHKEQQEAPNHSNSRDSLGFYEWTTSKGFSERLGSERHTIKAIIVNRAVIANIITSSLFLQIDFL